MSILQKKEVRKVETVEYEADAAGPYNRVVVMFVDGEFTNAEFWTGGTTKIDLKREQIRAIAEVNSILTKKENASKKKG